MESLRSEVAAAEDTPSIAVAEAEVALGADGFEAEEEAVTAEVEVGAAEVEDEEVPASAFSFSCNRSRYLEAAAHDNTQVMRFSSTVSIDKMRGNGA